MSAPEFHPRDDFGRPFDEFDAMRIRIALRDYHLVSPGQGYSVQSMSGKPLCGFVPDKPAQPIERFRHARWK